ncbi:MAG: sugar transferase, partial [Chitinophagaceae bacterium]
MMPMQAIMKRLLDILISVCGLIILMPLIIFVAIRVYFSSNGSILYLQERVGYKGRKFTIKKF